MTGKKKGKVKYASAEAKRLAEQQAQEWAQIKARHKVMDEKITRKPDMKSTLGGKYVPQIPAGRTIVATSHEQTWDPCLKAPDKVYTGTKMIGIAVQHKSCLQPVFSQEEAEQSAKMRR